MNPPADDLLSLVPGQPRGTDMRFGIISVTRWGQRNEPRLRAFVAKDNSDDPSSIWREADIDNVYGDWQLVGLYLGNNQVLVVFPTT